MADTSSIQPADCRTLSDRFPSTTVATNASVSFIWSYPNRLPLSGAVVDWGTRHFEEFAFDRIYGNFDNVIASDARAVVRRSADRHIAWADGEFDHLT